MTLARIKDLERRLHRLAEELGSVRVEVSALEAERDYLKGRVTILEMARDLQEVDKDLPPLRQRYFHEPRPGEETDGA